MKIAFTTEGHSRHVPASLSLAGLSAGMVVIADSYQDLPIKEHVGASLMIYEMMHCGSRRTALLAILVNCLAHWISNED